MSIDSIISDSKNIISNCKDNTKDDRAVKSSKKTNPCHDSLEKSNFTNQRRDLGNVLLHDNNKNPGSTNAFVFDSMPRTVRFTWKLDASGYIREISEELSKAIGPYTFKMIGVRLCDINHILRIDPDNHIVDLLQKQNTWYGKNTIWPIEGTELHVPIDLAALPIYSRDREFTGFKGFGIVHVNRVSKDSHALGKILEEKLSSSSEVKKDLSFVGQECFDLLSKSSSQIHLSKKNKVSFPPQHYYDKDDALKITKYPLFKDEENRIFNQENFHTINLNQYINKKHFNTPKNNNQKSENLFHCNHPSLSEYFAEGENIVPETIEKCPIPFCVYSYGNLFYANSSFLLLTKYKSIADIEKSGGLSTLLNAQKLSKNNTAGSVMLCRSDGTRIAVSAHLHTIQWNGENSLAMTFVPLEINNTFSENVSHEETNNPNMHKMEIEAVQLFSILEATSDGVAIINEDGLIISTNRKISKLFDYPTEDMLKKPFTMFFENNTQNVMHHYLVDILSLNQEQILEKTTIGRTREGNILSIRIIIKKLPFSNCYSLIIHDISEENDLSHAIKKAKTESLHKSDFLARVSHEIRTPLTAIIGFSEVIKNQKFGPLGSPRYIEYANYIDRSGNLVLDIVNDLLDISKIESGKMNLHFESVSLNETVSEIISLVQLYANEKRILIRTSFSDNIPQIFADLRSVKQIALNILSNAIRFTPSGGQIIISTTYTRKEEVVLRVRDTGVGMSNYELEQALEPFGQIPNSQQIRGEGTGLGLPLAKAMVDANMGKFYVSSIPTKGTLIEIIFLPHKLYDRN
ncbi:PAS domain-containing sensor histidine kinase [Candidatus Liberibacter africanus]|uniref:histidine kinase n=1 Tax=Candidatus Liberibacter africanus PTSAPSY TaxID=1277257 RepID=A0A0G3I2X7_LIBAF|nr:PAS domain-containing sensor histidine kinase [Candidatus Liberibacter africanus]AKK20244.1 PAS/PAC sensor signal transduction histidine kinase [Candidatus Liberibacter africanus PTSAPSY]QTP64016.1 PAS domain-containing sensor histidine kinase [Candidatus Liberibacter africanus]